MEEKYGKIRGNWGESKAGPMIGNGQMKLQAIQSSEVTEKTTGSFCRHWATCLQTHLYNHKVYRFSFSFCIKMLNATVSVHPLWL